MKYKENMPGLFSGEQTTKRLARHDLIFGSPLNDPSAGIPLGDGSTGSLVWFEEDGIHIQVNHTDLWEDGGDEASVFCSGIDEDVSCLRHGGEVMIRFHGPCLDLLYQKNFEARLSLTDATLKLKAETDFSQINASVFASSRYKTTVLRCHMKMKDPDYAEISLSRWGSRNLWRWYMMKTHNVSIGLQGTETELASQRIYIRQKLHNTEFCIGLAVVADEPFDGKRLNCHEGRFETPRLNEQDFTILWNVSLGVTVDKAMENCKKALDETIAAGIESVYEKHVQDWSDYWNTSYVSIGDDFVENCYYLIHYYANCQCKGEYPPLFTSGIWNFRHDFYPWAYYFHYNMQHLYGPLDASGHPELAENYYRMRRDGLENAIRYAHEVKGKKGCFYHDICDRKGRGATYDNDNCTPGSQIAMAMWHHYRMTGNEAFLQNVALPVMKEAANFYLDLLRKEEDGLYHLYGTTAYEGTPQFNDTITDIVMIRALFQALQGCVSEDEKGQYRDVLDHLPPYTLVPMDEDEVTDGCLNYGYGKGRPVEGQGLVFSIGKDAAGKPIRKNYGDASKCFYGFPDTEMSPIYPSGIFGIANAGTEEFFAMRNQLHLHVLEDCMQWCMMPIYLARMGMGEDVIPYLRDTFSRWMIYPNGFCVDGPNGITDAQNRLKYNDVRDTTTDTVSPFEAYSFRHYDMETLPIAATAINESLLQSHEGILRIFPAVKASEAVSFVLYAEGGFRVSGDLREGTGRVLIESLRGEPCVIKLPEVMEQDGLSLQYRSSGEKEWKQIPFTRVTRGAEEVLLPMQDIGAGDALWITNGDPQDMSFADGEASMPNTMWKTCGNAHLGTPPLIG